VNINIVQVDKNYDEAEKHYLRAAEASPKSAKILNNYAQFLKTIRKDNTKAEEYFMRAIEAEPKHTISLNNYAQFVKEVRFLRKFCRQDSPNQCRQVKRDVAQAESLYKRAIESSPGRVDILYNYTVFLLLVKKDYEVILVDVYITILSDLETYIGS
jgi:Tfp pilus assembly protein PilF